MSNLKQRFWAALIIISGLLVGDVLGHRTEIERGIQTHIAQRW